MNWIGTETRECFGAPGQIDIVKDERLEEITPDDKGWTKVRNKQGDEGLVPTQYLAKEMQKIWQGVQTRECFGAEDQIDIHKGEEVEEMVPDVKGWTRVRNKLKEEGLVPTKLLVRTSPQKPKIWVGTQKWECFGAANQIDVHEGDEFEEIIPDVKGWTKIRNKRREDGMVPTKYLAALSKQMPIMWMTSQKRECFGGEGQIDIDKGEVVEEVFPDIKGWTKVRNKNHMEGLVPTKLLVPVTKKLPKVLMGLQTRECLGALNQIDIRKDEEVEEVDSDENGWTRVKNTQGDIGLVPTKLLVSSTGGRRKRMKCVEAWDCFGADGQISIQIGEKVDAMTGDTKGWTKVKHLNGKEGKVPTKSLEILKERKVHAEFSSEGRQGVLDLEEGETVEELEPDREGWAKLKKANGEVGIAPTNHLGT